MSLYMPICTGSVVSCLINRGRFQVDSRYRGWCLEPSPHVILNVCMICRWIARRRPAGVRAEWSSSSSLDWCLISAEIGFWLRSSLLQHNFDQHQPLGSGSLNMSPWNGLFLGFWVFTKIKDPFHVSSVIAGFVYDPRLYERTMRRSIAPRLMYIDADGNDEVSTAQTHEH